MAAWCLRLGAAAIRRPTSSHAQDDRQLARHGHVRHLEHQLAAAQRDVEEELQPGERGVDGDRAGAGVDQVQLEAAQVLGGGGVGERPRKVGQLAHGADVALLRVLGSNLRMRMSSSMR
jgi:hypothetical protein